MALGANHGLQPGLEPVAGHGHGVPVQAVHGLDDGSPQIAGSVVGPLVDVTLQKAPHKIVQGIS